MFFSNAVYLDEEFHFQTGGFSVENGRFASFSTDRGGEDCNGCYVFPGLIDIHLHGNSGVDFSNCEEKDLHVASRYLAVHGITSFSLTTLTMPPESIRKTCQTAKAYCDNGSPFSALRGITLEGPFLSPKKKGAQEERFLRMPDSQLLKDFDIASGHLIKIVCIAPELAGALAFIKENAARYRMSIAHTTADYATTKRAIEAGAAHLTHTFNAMTGIGHKEPGVIPAASEALSVMAELICDGVHVHPSTLMLAYKVFGKDRICFISDSLSPCGMPDGEYTIGEQRIVLADETVRLFDGTLAGSAANLFSCMKKAISFGWRLEDAVQCASLNPAKALGCDNAVGSIKPGKQADFIVCTRDLNIRAVYIAGRRVV